MTTNDILKAMINEGATVKVLRFRKETWELEKKDGSTVRLRSNSASAAVRGSDFKIIEQTITSSTYAWRPVR